MTTSTPDQVDISVISYDSAAAERVKAVIQTLGFRASEFANTAEFLQARNLIAPSCVVVCAGDQTDAALELQSQFAKQKGGCPSVVVVSEIEVRRAVKLMELGAMTVLTNGFDKAELADYLASAAEIDQERRAIRQRVKELETCRESLSDRQLKILNMVEQGHSNRQIANWFDLSQRTIELERARLMSAFQSASVAQLVSKWTELRVLSKSWHSTDNTHSSQQDQVLDA